MIAHRPARFPLSPAALPVIALARPEGLPPDRCHWSQNRPQLCRILCRADPDFAYFPEILQVIRLPLGVYPIQRILRIVRAHPVSQQPASRHRSMSMDG
jgi:hypothetical protein